MKRMTIVFLVLLTTTFCLTGCNRRTVGAGAGAAIGGIAGGAIAGTGGAIVGGVGGAVVGSELSKKR